MSVRLSRHLKERMILRDIPDELPETVYWKADNHYTDIQTGTMIAVKRVMFRNMEREMALSYTKSKEDVLLITLHPLKQGQRERRVQSGRWVQYEP